MTISLHIFILCLLIRSLTFVSRFVVHCAVRSCLIAAANMRNTKANPPNLNGPLGRRTLKDFSCSRRTQHKTTTYFLPKRKYLTLRWWQKLNNVRIVFFLLYFSFFLFFLSTALLFFFFDCFFSVSHETQK